ncbi:hypothetical protein JCM2811A_31430 [Methylorubrum rhodinum]
MDLGRRDLARSSVDPEAHPRHAAGFAAIQWRQPTLYDTLDKIASLWGTACQRFWTKPLICMGIAES